MVGFGVGEKADYHFEDLRIDALSVMPVTVALRYHYDTRGWVVGRTLNPGTPEEESLFYVYDGARIAEQVDGDGDLVAAWDYGTYIDEPVAMHRDTDGDGVLDATWHYLQDDLYNVVGLVDAATGQVVERYTYDDYGLPTVWVEDGENPGAWIEHTTANGAPASAIGNPFLFTGRRWDPQLQLYDYRTRYYDPALGRFLRIDTIGLYGDPNNLGNSYTYVGNNPWSGTDPWGRNGGYLLGAEPPEMQEAERQFQEYFGIEPPSTEEKLEMSTRLGRVVRTGAVVGLNALAWGFTGPFGGVPVTGATLGLGGGATYYSRQAQYIEATGEQLGTQDSAFIVAGDLTGASAAYTMASGEDPLTGDKVSTADRVEAGAHLAVGLAAAEAGYRTGNAASKSVSRIPEADTATQNARAGVSRSHQGRQQRLREIAEDPKASSADRGWIRNEMRQVESGNRSAIRTPPGKDLRHPAGRPAAQGHDYAETVLQERALHYTQHRYLVERRTGTTIRRPSSPPRPGPNLP